MKNLILILGTPSSTSSVTMKILETHGCTLPLELPQLGQVHEHNEIPAVWAVSAAAHQYRYGTNHMVHDRAAYAKALHSSLETGFAYPPRLVDKGVKIIEAGADLQALKLPLGILVWDYWKTVFSQVSSMPKVTIGMLLRNPYEVAASWVRRFDRLSSAEPNTVETVYPILEAYFLCQKRILQEAANVVPIWVEKDRHIQSLTALLAAVDIPFDKAKFDSIFIEKPTLFTGTRHDHRVFELYEELAALYAAGPYLL